MDNPFFYVSAVLSEFQAASDRAAAIVGGAFLDEFLTELLQGFLVEDQRNDEKIFQGNGFLATFSSRIDLSYRLGLIAREEHKGLHTVRELRNRFAHELGTVTFMRQDIRALCANIELPLAMVAPRDIPLSQEGETPQLPLVVKADSSSPRAVFEEYVINQVHVFAARTALAIASRRMAPDQFSSAVEVARSSLTSLEQILTDWRGKVGSMGPEQIRANERYEAIAKAMRFSIQQMEAAAQAKGGVTR